MRTSASRTALYCLPLSLALLSGCASMADSMSRLAGVGAVEVEQSTFDDATIVTLGPDWLYNPDGEGLLPGNRIKLGARWNSTTPEMVMLTASYPGSTNHAGPGYVSITGLDVNLGGEIRRFRTAGATDLGTSGYNSVSRTVPTTSRNSVVVPMDYLQEMMDGEDVRIRIHTSSGYEDALFHIERMPGGEGTTKVSMREFLAAVEKARSAP